MGAPKDPKKHEEWRRKLSIAATKRQTGRKLSKAHRKAISKANKKAFSDPEVRAELSERARRQWANPESRAKLVSSLQSEETRAKQSVSGKKVWERSGHRQKMAEIASEQMQARWDDPEEAAKLRAANADPESRRKKSAACAAHWRDPIVGKRMLDAVLKVCSGHTYHKTGHYHSPKTNDKHYYRSSYELQAYMLLDTDPDVALYITEPMAIPYTYKGKTRRYIPDIYVELADGSWMIIEVKPEYQLNWPSVQAKLDAALVELPEGCFEVWCEAELFVM